jgi:hypothetical protein
MWRSGPAPVCDSIPGRARSCYGTQIFIQSQLIIVHLRRLEQTANLHGSIALLLLSLDRRLLTLLGKELCIVAGELFK